MAQYTVQAPDGHTITLEGPEGASHEDVIAQAQKLYSPRSAPGPGRGGRMPAGSPTAEAPDPATLSPMGRFAGGVDQILNLGGNRPNQRLQGLHNAFVGGSEVAAPLAIPALAAAPEATIGAAALGGVGKLAGTMIPQWMGASPDASEVIGDVASIPSAMVGGASGEAATPAIRGFFARGMPSWVPDVVGMVHPHAAFLMRSAGRLADALRSGDTTFEPVRPNPNIARTLRFGGPTEPGYSAPGKMIGMSGAPEVAPPPVKTFQPNKVNPNIAARIRFGGPTETNSGPAYSGVGMSGAPEPPAPPAPVRPAPFQPNKVNPAISRNLRYTPGGGEPSPGRAMPQATPGTRAYLMQQMRLRQQQNIAPPPVRPGE